MREFRRALRFLRNGRHVGLWCETVLAHTLTRLNWFYRSNVRRGKGDHHFPDARGSLPRARCFSPTLPLLFRDSASSGGPPSPSTRSSFEIANGKHSVPRLPTSILVATRVGSSNRVPAEGRVSAPWHRPHARERRWSHIPEAERRVRRHSVATPVSYRAHRVRPRPAPSETLLQATATVAVRERCRESTRLTLELGDRLTPRIALERPSRTGYPPGPPSGRSPQSGACGLRERHRPLLVVASWGLGSAQTTLSILRQSLAWVLPCSWVKYRQKARHVAVCW